MTFDNVGKYTTRPDNMSILLVPVRIYKTSTKKNIKPDKNACE
jgi:hypothetical protein